MQEDSREESYFEMDFSEQKDVENGFDNSNKLYSYSDMDYKWETPNLDSSLKVDLDQIPRKRSNSIPIQLYSCRAYSTDNQKLHSTKTTILNSTSSSLAGTPKLSASPSSSFIPRRLRTSFSKLLKRSSFSRGKNRDQDQLKIQYLTWRRTKSKQRMNFSQRKALKESLKGGTNTKMIMSSLILKKTMDM